MRFMGKGLYFTYDELEDEDMMFEEDLLQNKGPEKWVIRLNPPDSVTDTIGHAELCKSKYYTSYEEAYTWIDGKELFGMKSKQNLSME